MSDGENEFHGVAEMGLMGHMATYVSGLRAR